MCTLMIGVIEKRWGSTSHCLRGAFGLSLVVGQAKVTFVRCKAGSMLDLRALTNVFAAQESQGLGAEQH